MYRRGWTGADGTQHPSDNDQEAVHWYTKAANQGDPQGQNYLSRMYLRGWTGTDGTQHPPNLDQTVHWYTKAANQGHEAAQCNLSLIYCRGWTGADGIQHPPDLDQALGLRLKVCAQKGDFNNNPGLKSISINYLKDILEFAQEPLNYQATHDFSLEIDTSVQQGLLIEYAARFSPASAMAGTLSRPLYHALFKDTAANLLLLNKLTTTFDAPGFFSRLCHA